MYLVHVTTWIAAPRTACFDLARSVDAHLASSGDTGERVVGGRRAGLLELGEEVTWEACHFGITQRLSSRMTALQPTTYFQDRMTRGAFSFFEHDHFFHDRDGGTVMTDLLRFQAPGGPLGWVVERLVLGSHMRRFLVRRGLALKGLAERPTSPPPPGG